MENYLSYIDTFHAYGTNILKNLQEYIQMYTIEEHDQTGDGVTKYVVYKGDHQSTCKLTKRR